MSIVNRKSIIEVASAEIGTKESPKNSNNTKYGKWFGLDGVMWCGIFVSWCYAMAGRKLPRIGFLNGFAGCQTLYNYAKKNELIVKDPKEGDVVLFDWNNDKRYDHVGLFKNWVKEGLDFETIEGNTSLGNDSNGGCVMQRNRSTKSSYGVVFIRFS